MLEYSWVGILIMLIAIFAPWIIGLPGFTAMPVSEEITAILTGSSAVAVSYIRNDMQIINSIKNNLFVVFTKFIIMIPP